MPSTRQSPTDDTAPLAGPMPTYTVMRDFLDEDMVSILLDYAVRHESEFSATLVDRGILDRSIRISARLREFGLLEQEIRRKVWALAPVLIDTLKVPSFEPSRIEVELVAHGDGAFFKRHLDASAASDLEETRSQRLISGVYYFHTRPRPFSGGALRLYAFGADETHGTFLDLEPDWNTLIVFPSWAAHEVLQVKCPTRRFVDSRFAINCWFRRLKPPLRERQATGDDASSWRPFESADGLAVDEARCDNHDAPRDSFPLVSAGSPVKHTVNPSQSANFSTFYRLACAASCGDWKS